MRKFLAATLLTFPLLATAGCTGDSGPPTAPNIAPGTPVPESSPGVAPAPPGQGRTEVGQTPAGLDN